VLQKKKLEKLILPARVVVMPNVEKTRKNHDHHPAAFFARPGGGHAKRWKNKEKPWPPPSAHFWLFCASSQGKINVFFIFFCLAWFLRWLHETFDEGIMSTYGSTASNMHASLMSKH